MYPIYHKKSSLFYQDDHDLWKITKKNVSVSLPAFIKIKHLDFKIKFKDFKHFFERKGEKKRNRTNQSFQEALFLVFHSNSSFKTLIMSETMLLTETNDG